MIAVVKRTGGRPGWNGSTEREICMLDGWNAGEIDV